MPKYPENLIHFCNPVLEHYELDDEIPRMFVRSMCGSRYEDPKARGLDLNKKRVLQKALSTSKE